MSTPGEVRPGLRDYLWFAFTIVLVAILGVFAFVMSRLPPSVGTWAFWSAGQVAPFQVVVFLGTALIAIVSAALLLWRNIINTEELREQQKAALADRYKTGAELLSNDKPTVETAGIVVLQELAIERPSEYGSSIADLLAAHVSQSGRANAKLARGGVQKSSEIPEVPGVENALRALGTIQTRVPELKAQGTVLRSVDQSFIRGQYYGIDLSSLAFSSCVFQFARFTDVVARKARFSTVFRSVNFTRADLAESRFSNLVQRSSDGQSSIEFSYCRLQGVELYGHLKLRLHRCDLTGADLRRVTIASMTGCYFSDTPPELAVFFDEEGTKVAQVFDTDGPGTWETIAPGWRYFSPAKGARALSFPEYVEPEQEDDDISF